MPDIPPVADPRQRWLDCDLLESPIDRIDCRTSKLNDAVHHLETVVAVQEEKIADMVGKLGQLRITKWAAIIGMLATFVKMIIDLAGAVHR